MNRHAHMILRPLALLACVAWALPAGADGTLTHLSGPVSIQKADGKTLPGAVGAKAAAGDTVVTGAGGYARMEMTDGGEMVLRPDSRLKIESYNFVAAKPQEDSFVFSMVKGGLRTVTGLIGKRGDKDAYQLKTETATIGIRGTQFDLRVCAGNCGTLADGTYIAVKFGAIQASNPLGSLPVAAGQVAMVPPQKAPVILLRDPGIGFTPPVVIPKLDERKKQQPAAAAEPAKAPDGSAGTASPKSAPPEKPRQESGAKPEGGKTEPTPARESADSDASGRPVSRAAAPPVSSPPAASTVDCSVQ